MPDQSHGLDVHDFADLLPAERRLFRRHLRREKLPHGRDWYHRKDLLRWRLLRTFEELEKSRGCAGNRAQRASKVKKMVEKAHKESREEIRRMSAEGRGWEALRKNVALLGIDTSPGSPKPKMIFGASARRLSTAGKRELKELGFSSKSIAAVERGLAESAARKTLYRGAFAERRKRKRGLSAESEKMMSKTTVGSTKDDLDAVRGGR
jgi:hypothetical protein